MVGAQVEEFNLKKPSAYNYDLALLGGITAAFGLIGLPPINGVLPQVPKLLFVILSAPATAFCKCFV